MTRINVIPVNQLCRQHLLAEHREIKRIPNALLRGVKYTDIPDSYRLGTGHVKFFYNKIPWLYQRYKEIYAECKARGYNVEWYGESFEKVLERIPKYFWVTWTPTERDITINQERITQRLLLM